MTKPSRPLSYWLRHRRQKCECSGYWFPHRRGGGACDHSPRADYYIALRQGLSQAEAMALLAVHVLEDLPKGEGSTPNLPSVTNVVTELMKEGWPKEAAA